MTDYHRRQWKNLHARYKPKDTQVIGCSPEFDNPITSYIYQEFAKLLLTFYPRRYSFHFCLTVLCITLRDTGNELVPTAATIENLSTLDTFKGPASKVQRSTITKSVATKISITEKEENISVVSPSTTSNVLRQKQTSSGLEDFLLLRKGKHDTLKPPCHRQCTPPSKEKMIIDNKQCC